ncbi:MAG TPA: TAXI family TRAP transporter solute-binding subunit [Archangium sp.]|uniref:TAXI family TRAP transporter solute-binding subunit n=1 Tax=Archangium sp. TaxID=1872627 RepID=UPI002E371C0B|nr:TAXI family TRAP transporter solute-binding subunit [Archangium sp.]HEX5748259.1 TAXI family TRAP transporter solute-binding subunit [Archangium sp.]
MKTDSLKEQLRRTTRRDLWLTVAPAALIIGIAFAVTFYFVKPAPPMKLVLATAQDEGGFRYFAKKYQESLARHGVTVEIQQTKGSVTSVEHLSGEQADVAFVQSGTADEKKAPGIVSLGSLSYVPLWVFYRGEPIDDVLGLKGKRIAIGDAESGTHALARTLLSVNGADQAPTELLPLGRDAAIEQLKKGQLDAVFIVAPAEAPAIQKLAVEPGVRLMSFARGEAYVRRYPYLSKLVLPRGVFNFAADIPERDVVLLAPTANLVARDSLHPALAYLLMRTASEIHGSAGLLDRSGEFPAPLETGFPLSSEARRYYQAGIPLLQRYLPFWAANLVDRLWVMLVPIIAVVVPLGRAVPALYLWRVRSRIFRWYARLKEIELQLEENPGREMLEDMMKRLEEAERAVNRIPVPLAYAENLYFFREHIDVVRRRLSRRLSGAPESRELVVAQVTAS